MLHAINAQPDEILPDVVGFTQGSELLKMVEQLAKTLAKLLDGHFIEHLPKLGVSGNGAYPIDAAQVILLHLSDGAEL